jgi:flavodoxin
MMRIEVRYVSRGGQTQKVAEAIARATGVAAEDCSVPLNGQVDLLLLGAAMYWGGADKRLKDFIAQLDPATVGRVAVFGTSSIVEESTREIERLLLERGIAVSGRFSCWGQFAALHKGHPDNEDLRAAAAFAMGEARGL